MNDLQSDEAFARDGAAGSAVSGSGYALYLLAASALVGFVIYSTGDYSIYLPLVLLAVLYFALSLRFPMVWIVSLILFHAFYLQRSEGVTLVEVVFGIYLFVPLGIWFYRKIFLRREPLCTSWFDYLLLGFVGVCVLSLVVTTFNGFSLVRGLRELVVYATYLFYFPVRDEMRDEHKVKFVLGAFLILSLMIALQNLFLYETRVAAATYYWQILGSRQTAHEPFFVTAIMIAIPLFLRRRSWGERLFWLGVGVFFAVALVATFSRGYWVGVLAALGVYFLLEEGRVRQQFIRGAVGLFALTVIVMVLAFGDLARIVLEVVAERFGSIGTFMVDPSITNRFAESRAVLSYIAASPILGYGLGSTYSYHSLLVNFTITTDYIHNAYLSLWLKLGVAGIVLYLACFGLMIVRGVKLSREAPTQRMAPILLGLASVLIAMLEITVTSPQFYAKDAVLIITLAWGIIGAVWMGRRA